MRSETTLRYVELAFWVIAVALIIVAVAVLLGFATGDGLLGAKYVLFVVGFLLFGLGSLGIQPTPPNKEGRRLSLEADEENRLEAAIQELPPLREDHLPFDRRVDRGVKIFLTSLVVLGVSAILEFGLDVTV